MRTHADATHNTEAGSGRTRTSGARRLKVGLAAMAGFMATFAGILPSRTCCWQVQDRQASIEASVSMPALTHAQARQGIAFLLSLRGQAN